MRFAGVRLGFAEQAERVSEVTFSRRDMGACHDCCQGKRVGQREQAATAARVRSQARQQLMSFRQCRGADQRAPARASSPASISSAAMVSSSRTSWPARFLDTVPLPLIGLSPATTSTSSQDSGSATRLFTLSARPSAPLGFMKTLGEVA
jgi:hypothetical protein